MFLSPPWGGPEYRNEEMYDIQSMIPMDGVKIFNAAREITEDIAYYVPRNVDTDQMASLARPGGQVQLQKNILGGRPQAITAYYGNLCDKASPLLPLPINTDLESDRT